MDHDGHMLPTDASAAATPLPVVVLGTSWCEDTALVRSRLQALDVPFREHDVEVDAAAGARIRELNGGAQITPTVVLGDAQQVIAEPSLEQLGDLLAAGGWPVRPPTATQYRAPITQRPIPRPPRDLGEPAVEALDRLRRRRQVALFLAHGVECLACFGYARQLGRQTVALAEANAVAVVVVRSTLEAAHEWRDDIDQSVLLVADPDGAWSRSIAAHVGVPRDDVALLALDRWHAARAGSVAVEAGGLIDLAEAVRWLEFVELECSECAGEIAWDAAPNS